ncbi:MAG: hypothetical protein J5I94_21705 [Phaeodactylibacter sp.]|nr:hypothetical protein [Phaeodactylibacter sp.]
MARHFMPQKYRHSTQKVNEHSHLFDDGRGFANQGGWKIYQGRFQV